MSRKSLKKIDSFISFVLLGLVFALPLFFLPATKNLLIFSKQYLLWLCLPVLAFLLVWKFINTEKTIRLKRTPLDIPVMLFLFFILLSSVFSMNSLSSFFGQSSTFGFAWLDYLSLSILFFLVVNISVPDEFLKMPSIFKLIVYSYFAVCLFSILSFFTFWQNIFNLSTSYNLVSGNYFGVFSVFSAAMFILHFGLWRYRNTFFKNQNNFFILLIINLFLSFVVIFLVNIPSAWIALLIGSFIYLLYELAVVLKEKLNKKRLFIPLIFSTIALIFFVLSIFNFNYLKIKQITPEPQLNFSTSWHVTTEVLKEGLLFGSGPGTFGLDFSKFRPADFNASSFWSLRFTHSYSYVLEILSTSGIVGFLSFLLIVGIIIYLAIIFLNKYFVFEESEYTVVMFAVLFGLLAIFFTANPGIVLFFLFWLFLGMLMSRWKYSGLSVFRDKIIQNHKKVYIIIIFIIFSAWLILFGFETKFLIADIYFSPENESRLLRSVELNSGNSLYQVALSKYYLNELKKEIVKPRAEQEKDMINIYVTKSIFWAKKSIATNPISVVGYETLAMIYRDIRYLAAGSAELSIESFQSASKLEPANPVLWTEIGKLYLEMNDSDRAIENFTKALELKNDFNEAKLYLAKVYAQVGKNEEALDLLGSLSNYKNEEVYYEQGKLFYNLDNVDGAIERFIQVIKINPNHSNALYSLGVAMERKGKNEEALKYYKKVLVMNPGNIEVMARIKGLE